MRDLDDETAYEVMITENLQRKDIDPMEEAFAFNELVKSGKSADEIAQRFGKPLRFVQSRVKLAALIPEGEETRNRWENGHRLCADHLQTQ